MYRTRSPCSSSSSQGPRRAELRTPRPPSARAALPLLQQLVFGSVSRSLFKATASPTRCTSPPPTPEALRRGRGPQHGPDGSDKKWKLFTGRLVAPGGARRCRVGAPDRAPPSGLARRCRALRLLPFADPRGSAGRRPTAGGGLAVVVPRARPLPADPALQALRPSASTALLSFAAHALHPLPHAGESALADLERLDGDAPS